MAIISIPTSYYQQYDADFALKVPGQGYGGWKKALIKIDTSPISIPILFIVEINFSVSVKSQL